MFCLLLEILIQDFCFFLVFSLYFVCACFPMCIGYLHTLGPNGDDSLTVCVYACMHFIILLHLTPIAACVSGLGTCVVSDVVFADFAIE